MGSIHSSSNNRSTESKVTANGGQIKMDHSGPINIDNILQK
jgi:hypothetical protein